MPIHDYRCTKCGNVFEKITRSHREIDDNAHCAKCGAPAVRLMPKGVKFKWGIQDASPNPNVGEFDESGKPPSNVSYEVVE